MIRALKLFVAVALLILASVAATPAAARFTSSPAVGGNVFNSDLLNAPTGLTGSGGSTISLSWTATSDTYASGHRVLRGTASGGPYTQVSEITPRSTTTYNETPAAGTYYYVTRAFYGNWESANSSETSATISSSTWLATGSYVGNLVDNRTITVGFQADVVIVKCLCGQAAVVRTSTMSGDATKVTNDALALHADMVQSLTATGFVIGTQLEVNGTGASNTYHWIAMKAGANLKVGSYTGNATDNRSITGVGFQPVWLMTLGDGENAVMRPGTAVGDVSYQVEGSGQIANRIQALQADGFQLGDSNNVNKAATTFYYIAWKATSSVVNTTYTGNGVDNRSISGVGFSPAFVWIKKDASNAGTWRSDTFVGDSSIPWDSADAANNIQALESNGFQIGTHARVNTNGSVYHYLALKN